MAKYQIPGAYRPGFLTLAKLKSEQISSIVSAINIAPIGVMADEMSKQFESKLDVSSTDIANLFQTIFSLLTLSMQKEELSENLAKDLVIAYQSINKDIKPEEIAQLESNLIAIFKSEGKIKNTIKALTLQSDNENVFQESRLISDIRLVFEEKISNKVQGAVIVHQLRINYRNSGELRKIVISLDINDLNQLKEMVERAVEKDKLITTNTFTKDLSFVSSKK